MSKPPEATYAEDPGLKAALDVKKRLQVLANLSSGWLDGEGLSLDGVGLERVETVLLTAESEGLPRPYLYPTADGALLAEWSFPDAEISAEVDLGVLNAQLVGTNLRSRAIREQVVNLREASAVAEMVDFVLGFSPAGGHP